MCGWPKAHLLAGRGSCGARLVRVRITLRPGVAIGRAGRPENHHDASQFAVATFVDDWAGPSKSCHPDNVTAPGEEG
jgi:hypothetical protein